MSEPEDSEPLTLHDIPLEGEPAPRAPAPRRHPSYRNFHVIVPPSDGPVRAAFAFDEALFREILAHQPTVSVALFNTDLRYVFGDGETLATFDLSTHEVVGARVGEFSGSAHILEPACQAVLNGDGEQFLRAVQLHGEWFDIDAFPIVRGGVVVGGVLISKNITHRHRNGESASVLQRGILALKLEKLAAELRKAK